MPSSNNPDSILVTYYCGDFETNVARRCEKLANIQEQHLKWGGGGYAVLSGELPEDWGGDFRKLVDIEGLEIEYSSPDFVDTCIVDTQVIGKIKELLKKRKPISDYYPENRMYVTIRQGNGKAGHLCFNNFFSKTEAKYNGKECLVNEELVFLLRYHSGYYLWFGKSELEDFIELKNSNFYKKVMEQKELNKGNPYYAKD